MSRLLPSWTPVLAAPLLVLALAACGDASITSDEAQKSCEKGNGSAVEKQLSDEQKTNYCKCLLPKLDEAGYDKASDFEDAIKDAKGIAIIRACAQKYLTRGYS